VRTMHVSDALPARLMVASRKRDVIAYLAASTHSPVQRRRWFREWCVATFTKCRREDLARVAPPTKPREEQLSLLEGL
jgi:hypothetical protein